METMFVHFFNDPDGQEEESWELPKCAFYNPFKKGFTHLV